MTATLAMAYLLVAAPAFCAIPRENTVWDTAYWYNANEDKLPRVLLLGDSIIRGYESRVRDELAGVASVAFWATSRCPTDPSYLKQLAYILEEQPYAVIHFNNGLHSLNTDPKEWATALRAAYALLHEKAPGAKIIWTSSTPVKDAGRTGKVKVLNAIGERIAQEQGLPIDDLFALMDPLDRAVFWTDTYHFNPEARAMQGVRVSTCIRAALGGKTATPAEARAALKAAESETGPDGPIVTGKPAGK
jgi:hypothetical protein